MASPVPKSHLYTLALDPIFATRNSHSDLKCL